MGSILELRAQTWWSLILEGMILSLHFKGYIYIQIYIYIEGMKGMKIIIPSTKYTSPQMESKPVTFPIIVT
jgi:hypothetical protein